jgi:hypothetical protein
LTPRAARERCLRGFGVIRDMCIDVHVLSTTLAVESMYGYYLPVWTVTNTVSFLASLGLFTFGRTDSEIGLTDDGFTRGPHDGFLLCETQEYIPLEFRRMVSPHRISHRLIGHVDLLGMSKTERTLARVIVDVLELE